MTPREYKKKQEEIYSAYEKGRNILLSGLTHDHSTPFTYQECRKLWEKMQKQNIELREKYERSDKTKRAYSRLY
jgi:hypothetical protein